MTELEWKFGLLKRYKSLYLFVPNIRANPIGAKIAMIGWRGKKKAVKYDVFIMYAYSYPS